MSRERADGRGMGWGSGPVPSAAPGARPLVLVVEDDPDSRAIYRMILRASGYAVVETGNGTEGLRLACACEPDLVLLDLEVPGTDGWIVTRVLREREETATIPVVVLTAHVLPEHETRAREAGCSAFLSKPIAPREIVEEIRRILRPHPPAERPVLPA